MKKLLTLILWSVIFNAVAFEVQAQDHSSCFMLDGNGKPMDLGYLCQNSTRNRSRNTAPQTKDSRLQTYQQKKVHTVPIKGRLHGIPVIDVVFNDDQVFMMMLDTGASGIVITSEMSQALNVQHYGTVRVATPNSNNVRFSEGYVYSVQVAGVDKRNVRVMTSPTMPIGLLGQSFFGEYDMTIRKNVIEFKER